MQNTGVIGKLYQVSEWIMRLSLINLLLIIFNIPIAYFFLSLFVIEEPSQLWMLIISILVLLPFMFFPAVTAMFAVVRKWVMDDKYAPILKTFWKSYRSNFIRSVLGGLIIVPMWGIWLVDYYLFSNIHILMKIFFIILAIYLYGFTMYFFANTVHFNMSLRQTIKNSFFLSTGNPINTLLLVLSNVAIIYISFNIHPVLVIFFMISTAVYLSFAVFYFNIRRIEDLKDNE